MEADEPVDLSPHDRQRISAAIQAAERRTTGEIVCVLARHSAESTALPILLAALAALALPWLLVGLTTLPVLIILSLQFALFLGLAAMLSVPRVRVGLLPKATRQAIAHRAAMEQFMLRGIGRTEGRTGVLVFVSLAERYARIVADEAIASRVAQADWQSAIDALVEPHAARPHRRRLRRGDRALRRRARHALPRESGRAQRAAGQDLPDLSAGLGSHSPANRRSRRRKASTITPRFMCASVGAVAATWDTMPGASDTGSA